MRYFKLYIPPFFLLLMLTVSSYAQSNAGMIRGTVADQAGAAIPGAIVRLTNPISGYRQEAVTNSRGNYLFLDVPYNRYTLAVEARGFALSSREVSVTSDLAQQINIQLGVAPIRQEVQVNASSLLESERTAPSTVIDQNRIQTFPTAQPSRSTEQI